MSMEQKPPAKYAWEELNYLPPQSQILVSSSLSEDYLIMLVIPKNNNPRVSEPHKCSLWLLDTTTLKFSEIEHLTKDPLDFYGTPSTIIEMLSEGTTIVISCQNNVLWTFKLSPDYKTILTANKILYQNFTWNKPGLVVLYKKKIYLQEYPPIVSIPKPTPTFTFMLQHTSTLIPVQQNSNSPNYEERLVSLDINTGATSEHRITGPKPSPKVKYNIAGYGNKMFLLSGSRSIEGFDIWTLNLDKMIWECLSLHAITFPKKCNSMSCATGKNIYLFLEIQQGPGVKSGELISYNLENQILSHIQTSLPEGFQFDGARPKQLIPSRDQLFQIHNGQIYYLVLPNQQNQENEKGDSNSLHKKLFNDRLFADIEFKITEKTETDAKTETIPAHKAVLSVVSPYYMNMFTSGMMETDSKVIEVTDIRVEVFKALLEYIYCSTVTLTEDIAWDLLQESDKKMLPELKKICERFLIRFLNPENAFDAINLAIKLEAFDLRDAAIKYASKTLSEKKP